MIFWQRAGAREGARPFCFSGYGIVRVTWFGHSSVGFRTDRGLCICDPADDKRLVSAEANFFVDEGEFARLNERIDVVKVLSRGQECDVRVRATKVRLGPLTAFA